MNANEREYCHKEAQKAQKGRRSECNLDGTRGSKSPRPYDGDRSRGTASQKKPLKQTGVGRKPFWRRCLSGMRATREHVGLPTGCSNLPRESEGPILSNPWRSPT